VVAAEGTYLLWLDCRELGLADEALKRFFIERARLGLSPGSLFGQGGNGFMRLNLGAPRGLIREAVQRLVEAVRRA